MYASHITTLCNNLCYIFNSCISSNTFPVSLKLADISPVFKKKDPLCKDNYRSVNILNAISKVFERIIADQLTTYFDNILSSSLSAYRSGYSSQHVLIQLTEYWRQCLDEGNAVSTIAMDLSKAFDCMPHALLIAKLHAYGLTGNACNLLSNYLKNRLQRVKLQGSVSDWATINRGVPQGSVLGPLLFNIFINDLFYLNIDGRICNYADDNHLSNHSKCLATLQKSLENDSSAALSWFEENSMKANADKFQCMSLTRGIELPFSISLQGNIISSCPEIKVLGVTLDAELNFNSHISNICSTASRQINILKRLSKYLNQESRTTIYKSFISSNFNYCPVAWIFCGKQNSQKLEKLQKRALRFVYNDRSSDYHTLLKKGNFLSLTALRLRALAVEVYKSVKGLNPNYINQLFEIRSPAYCLRDPFKVKQRKFTTKTFGYKSFGYYGSKLWNTLPVYVKSSETISIFKKRITEWCHSTSIEPLMVDFI